MSATGLEVVEKTEQATSRTWRPRGARCVVGRGNRGWALFRL